MSAARVRTFKQELQSIFNVLIHLNIYVDAAQPIICCIFLTKLPETLRQKFYNVTKVTDPTVQ